MNGIGEIREQRDGKDEAQDERSNDLKASIAVAVSEAAGPAGKADASWAADESALWKVCEEMRPMLRALVADRMDKQTASRVDASDVVQQSLAAAFRARGNFRGRSIKEWQAWVVAITKNEVLDLQKFWRRQRRDVTCDYQLGDAAGGLELRDRGDESPSRRAVERERAEQVLAVVEGLPDIERDAVRLRHLEGKSLAELAAALGRTPAAAAGVLKRAMKRLRERLKEST